MGRPVGDIGFCHTPAETRPKAAGARAAGVLHADRLCVGRVVGCVALEAHHRAKVLAEGVATMQENQRSRAGAGAGEHAAPRWAAGHRAGTAEVAGTRFTADMPDIAGSAMRGSAGPAPTTEPAVADTQSGARPGMPAPIG
jgi:hypothetical protein